MVETRPARPWVTTPGFGDHAGAAGAAQVINPQYPVAAARELARSLPFKLKMKPVWATNEWFATQWFRRRTQPMRLTKLAWLSAGLTLLAALGASGQTNPATSSATITRSGQVVSPERPTAIDANALATTSVRPATATRPALSPEVQARIDRFKLDARAYLAEQQALKKKLLGANDQERQIIRDRLRVLRQQWLEQASEMRREFKDRVIELQDKLPAYKDLLDSAKENARDQLRQIPQETHTHRGDGN